MGAVRPGAGAAEVGWWSPGMGTGMAGRAKEGAGGLGDREGPPRSHHFGI